MMNLKLEIYRSIPGLKLPDPLPPVPQIIARLQTVIAETELRQRQLATLDINKCNDDRLLGEAANIKGYLSILKLRLDQLLAAYPQHAPTSQPMLSMPSIMSMPGQENQNIAPPCEPPVDNQPTPPKSDPTQPDPQANQTEPDANQTDPHQPQPDPQLPRSEPTGRTAPSAVPLDASSSLAVIESELQELALEFRNLRDKRSPLDQLTDADHQAIVELLHDYSYAAVARILAKPRPIGLDLQTSDSALKRFVARRQRNQRIEDFYRAQKIAETTGPLDGFLKASSFMLETRLLRVATDESSNPEKIQSLIKSLTALRRQILAERKQTHLEKRPSL